VASLALPACPDAVLDLAPLQLGVGLAGCVGTVGHGKRAGIVVKTGCLTMQVDFRNTFNSMPHRSPPCTRPAGLCRLAVRQLALVA
jgi:hypothetical protein